MQTEFVSNISTLAEQFENETLPKASWTHHAHLSVGLYYVLNYGKEEALHKIRINIKKYNVAVGGQNNDSSGYHETLTIFWIWSINEFLQTADKQLPAEELCKQLIESNFSDRTFPFEFYSRDYLLSAKARLNFAEPDIKAFQ